MPTFLSELLSRYKAIWSKLDGSQRLMFAGVLIGSVVFITGVAIYSSRPDDQQLRTASDEFEPAELERLGATNFYETQSRLSAYYEGAAREALAMAYPGKARVTLALELDPTYTTSRTPIAPRTPVLASEERTTDRTSSSQPGGKVSATPATQSPGTSVGVGSGVYPDTYQSTRRSEYQELIGEQRTGQHAPLIKSMTMALALDSSLFEGLTGSEKQAKIDGIKDYLRMSVVSPEGQDLQQHISVLEVDLAGVQETVETAGAVGLVDFVAENLPLFAQIIAVVFVLLFVRSLLKRTELSTATERVGANESVLNQTVAEDSPGEELLRGERTKRMSNEAMAPGDVPDATESVPRQAFGEVCGEDLATALAGEHPQIAAVFLAHLDRAKAGSVLAHIDEDQRADLLRRVATLDRTPPDLVQRVLDVMRKKVEGLGLATQRSEPRVWIRAAAEILNHLDGGEKAILEQIGVHDEGIANSIRDEMFTFEDISKLDRQSMQMVLSQVDTRSLALSLKAVTPPTEENVFGNLSRRAADRVAEERDLLGPTPLSDVIEAQQHILVMIRDLMDRGEVMVAKADEPLV